jgi:serine-type D-Ala-D-Ala carboxypeptidase/endopeptidase (penicillin-binding protein 4)
MLNAQCSIFNFQWKRSNPGFSLLVFPFLFLFLFSSCSVQKQITKSANKEVLDAAALQTAHVGISIYEPATNTYWYEYQGDKYFVPASNTKIPTCYAAMKYLGDSLVGLRYSIDVKGADTGMILKPTGDPTFLHPDFKNQPVFTFLNNPDRKFIWKYLRREFNSLGFGWSWDDYQEKYMVERSMFPIYGNLVKIVQNGFEYYAIPGYFNNKLNLGQGYKRTIERSRAENNFFFDTIPANRNFIIPFVADDLTNFSLLYDTVKPALLRTIKMNADGSSYGDNLIYQKVHSQPTDSVLKPMMHRSDNFFAEQSLLMVSNERLGIMNDEKIIDTILKTDLKDLPQKPRWADGSGLSRYNLFTPKDLVFILNKMKNEFGMERVKTIFPTGGQGTLAKYYIADSNYIYAKTGTLSGVVALSGYLYTKKGKELIFSVLVNNHQASGTEVRRAVEKFLQGVRNKY